MRAFAMLLLAALVAPAAADITIDVKAKNPVVALPVISGDKLNFVRSFRTWRKGCKLPDIYIETGGIDSSVEEPQYSQNQIRGGCGEKLDEYAGNLTFINATMKDGKFAGPPKKATKPVMLGKPFVADGMTVHVTGNTTSLHATIDRFAPVGKLAGGRRMQLKFKPSAILGWYFVDVGTARQLAILVGGRAPDGTAREQWMEIWAKPVATPQPIDVARAWLLAVAAKDQTALTQLTAPSFTRSGFGAATDKCKPLECVAATAAPYASWYDEQGFAKLAGAAKAPPALRSQAGAIAKLGNTLILFEGDDDKGSTALVIGVKAGKVIGVVEARTTR